MNSALLALLCAQAAGAAAPRTGEFTDDYKDPKTKALVMHYKMRAPAALPEERKLGLVVYFHGMNGNENSLYGFTTGAAQRVGIVDQYVIMGGKAKGAGWATSDDKDLLAWIAWAKETYPVDPRRVHIIGGSNGGWMVKRFGWEHQDLFASISPYCGGGTDFGSPPKGTQLGKPGTPMSPAETKTEWYYVHGTDDREVGVDSSRRSVDQLRQKGYRYVYRELLGHDHGSIFGVKDVSDDNLRFIHALRHKEIPLSKDERQEVATLSGKIKNEKSLEAAGPMLAEGSRIGGTPGGKVIGNAFDSSDPEIKKRAATTTESTLYGREIVMELIKLAKDKSDEVKAEAYKGLATAANWRYTEAQEHCIRTARSKGASAADRALAIECLGKAAKLALLGNFEDKFVIWTLVLLLDDDDPKIREAAFAQLKPAVKDTFEYQPDLGTTERKNSMVKWKSWCEKMCGPLNAPAGK